MTSRASADQAIRHGTSAVVLTVGGFAAAVSYSHIYDLASTHRQDTLDARLLPLCVDGLIIAASFVMLHETRADRDAPKLARWMLALGVAATVAANVLYGIHGGALASVISAWPAVSFLGCAEMLMYLLRAQGRTRHTSAVKPVPVPAAVPRAVPARVVPSTPGVSLQDEFAAEIASGKVPGIKAIQRRMGGGQPLAYQHQERLRALVAAAA
jgi:hypothetical protein